MHQRLIWHRFFMFFTPPSSVFDPMSTYETHILWTLYHFWGHFLELAQFMCRQENQNHVCIDMFKSHLLNLYYKLDLVLPPFIVPQRGQTGVTLLFFIHINHVHKYHPFWHIEHLLLAWITITKFLLNSFFTAKRMKIVSSMLSSFHTH